MSEEEKQKLERQLWNIADTLRGKMNADEFRVYILGFIFFKYLSEKMVCYGNELLEADGISYTAIDETSEDGAAMLEAIKEAAVERLGYMLKPSELFSAITARGNSRKEDSGDHFILEDLMTILKNIENSTMGTESEDDFIDLFEDMDLSSSKLGNSSSAKNTLIVKVLSHLNNIDFELSNSDSDVLGDAYEYLIGKFASGAGKSAGEFYTPQSVSKILSKIVTLGKSKLTTVYDPTCGSGSLLLRVQKEVDEVGTFYGQEMNRTTFNLARMNMILHDVSYRKFDLKQEDTLEHPQHIDKRFEAVVANPPFSAKWDASDLLMSDDRFSEYGKLAPKSKADMAFIQHMIYQLADNGTMAVVMPHGVLFRGAAEGHIRRYLIEQSNVLDAVIGLPANIFYGTGIPTAILVFKKCRTSPKDILFIDASAHFEKAKNQNALRSSDIERILEAYQKREFIDKYAYVATLDEVAENDYNLNIPRYVDTFEPEDPIDLTAVSQQLATLEKDMTTTNQTIADFCKELGIDSPV